MSQEKIKVKVRDRKGDFNNWIVYEETDNTYKVYAERDRSYITELYKKYIFHDEYNDNCLCSLEIKSPFSVMPKGYMKAEFIEIWNKKDEC